MTHEAPSQIASGVLSRRAVSGLVVVAGVTLAGCGSSDNNTTASPSSAPAPASAAPSATAEATTGGAPATSATPTGKRLAALSDVPTSGGVILKSDKIVVTRDAAGDVHAFSAVCTHQGCLVSSVASGTISCPCHGSKFNASTGAPTHGPAASPLPSVPVTVQNGAVYAT
jgi:Rieske Fe-S protein